MNTFTSSSTSTNVNLKANQVRTSLLLCIDAEWTKQQKKPQMLINSRSPIKITKSYDSFEINITNPREYGGVVSSIHNSNMIQMLKSPDWSECNNNISRVNSAIEEEFQLKKHLLSQNKLINMNIMSNNSNNNVNHSNSNSSKKDFEQKKTMNDVMKHGFMELRKIAKELKVCGRSGNANKRKSPDKRDSKKKISLFRKHQSANDTTTTTVQQCKQKYKIGSNKNLITFNDKEQNENKFTETKSKTTLIINNSVDDSTDSNDNNFIIKRSQNAELALHYRPNNVSQCQSPSPKHKNSKVTVKSPLHNAKNDNKRISFGMDNHIITLKGCSTFS